MIDWKEIDTVLLDMDGTLLDLHFDNYFWLSHLPKRYAEHHGICPEEATRQLHQRFNDKAGTLDWYCLEYWSRELSLNIRQLKDEIQHLISERPLAIEFLQALQTHNKKRVLITNAHPQSLELKLAVTGIKDHLDTVISSHQYQAPKEAQRFWQKLQQQQPFDPEKTLFIDDSESVLTSAETYGIRHLLSISKPDSQQPTRQHSKFAAIEHFDEILPLRETH